MARMFECIVCGNEIKAFNGYTRCPFCSTKMDVTYTKDRKNIEDIRLITDERPKAEYDMFGLKKKRDRARYIKPKKEEGLPKAF